MRSRFGSIDGERDHSSGRFAFANEHANFVLASFEAAFLPKEEIGIAILLAAPQITEALDHLIVEDQFAPPQHATLHPTEVNEEVDPAETRLKPCRRIDRPKIVGNLCGDRGDADAGVGAWRDARL